MYKTFILKEWRSEYYVYEVQRKCFWIQCAYCICMSLNLIVCMVCLFSGIHEIVSCMSTTGTMIRFEIQILREIILYA